MGVPSCCYTCYYTVEVILTNRRNEGEEERGRERFGTIGNWDLDQAQIYAPYPLILFSPLD